MYLKALELVGFKSFASKTKLFFEPGMTAIVGPNGCGKSNISDAIRWVLGEQSAKALRGSKMEDVIFNGTDAQKPLSLAEVSLTLAGCEEALGTAYDEVTVTRRVLRSGEGQYFINKTSCRLKDIHRLFMDTGIGTNSYSLMEQGRIDLILSSRPEDRRAVFEEASGITKFKADKKEAIRKLEQTEANLLRLADIIREVKRRILSLQRQAGKAKRYKQLQDELRAIDITLSRERLVVLAQAVETLESQLARLMQQEEVARSAIHETEQRAHALRAIVQQKETEIAAAMDAAATAAADRDRAVQTINVNHDRVHELQEISERDSKDADEAQRRLQTHEQSQATITAEFQQAKIRLDEAGEEVAQHADRLKDLDAAVEEIRRTLNQLRGESMELESRGARLQNELSNLDAQERNTVLRRERLSAELGEAKRLVEKFDSRRAEAEGHMDALRGEVRGRAEAVASLQQDRQVLTGEIHTQRTEGSNLQKQVATREAQTELVAQENESADGLPAGARRLLEMEDAPRLMGTLADHLQAEPEYQQALEVALRAWLDAVVLQDVPAVLAALQSLASQQAGSARLLAAVSNVPLPGPFPDLPGVPLRQHVKVEEVVQALADRLLAGVQVVDHFDQVPAGLVGSVLFVTRNGMAFRSDGQGEIWMPGAQESNPLTRKHKLMLWTAELDELRHQMAQAEVRLQELTDREKDGEQRLQEARVALEASQRSLAICEGEHQVKAEEARQARERAETVSFELNALVEQQSSSGDRRTAITRDIEAVRNRQAEVRLTLNDQNNALQHAEENRGKALNEVTEKRVQLSERRQMVTQWASQRDDLQARMAELATLIQERRQGLNNYQARIHELQAGIAEADSRLAPLEADVQKHGAMLAEARRVREEHTVSLRHIDSELHEKRAALEEQRNQRATRDVQLAEQRLRRQNTLDRMAQDYHLTIEQLEAESEPEWENGQRPDRETLETLVAELRTKLEAMGPVNLIAIEEHEELEERFQFLTEQQDDLIKAKNQLMEMIKRINSTTTEMFTRTFEQVNTNFQETFKQLFGGGNARLVLVDDEDVLESGIEIIARPPGKKLQTVSLLSGGERTMTAVALLFALYMVKPSPFCVLDELDAALDDANIGRFVTMVESFVSGSQFIIITHNRQTIEAADALYGVTMEKFGISKIMSVRFHQHAEGEAPEETPSTLAVDPA